jgi:hypothetical protein
MAWKFSAGDRIQRGFWPTTLIVAAMTVAAPLTAAVYGQISGAKQLEMTARKHELDTRAAFLGQAMDSKFGPEDRANALRFLRAVSTSDSAMLDWTDRELRVVEGEAETLKKESAKPHEGPAAEGLAAVAKAEQAFKKEPVVTKQPSRRSAAAEDLADADEDERRKL